MIDIEHRQMYRSNGLIDDLVLHAGTPDYIYFAAQVRLAIDNGRLETVSTSSRFRIEITCAPEQMELFTSLQNQEDVYPTMEEWTQRSIVRVRGSAQVLESLHGFLLDLPRRGEGYSYISEYAEHLAYSSHSPEWRLHVRLP